MWPNSIGDTAISSSFSSVNNVNLFHYTITIPIIILIINQRIS